ncbi:MAG: PAS domain S-box protein [Cyanobacteria bacterium P01_F01_bin.56]
MLKFLKNLPLRRLLLITFVGQLIGVVGLVGYLSLINGQSTVETLAVQVRQELTARIEQELRSYFETPHEINRLNAAAFARGELDIDEAQFGEAQLYQQLKISPTVAFAYCGSSRKGEFFGVLRSPQDGSLQLSYGNSNNKFLRDYYNLDVAGQRTFKAFQATKPYDARQRPWYRAALSAQKPAWTDVYIAFTTRLPNITASLPVYDRTGRQLLGVCATDVVLPEEFRSFLNSLEIGNSGQAFVLDRQGNLIANSSDEPLMIEVGDQVRSLQVLESQDPLVKGAGTFIQNTFGEFDQIRGSQQREFRLKGQRQFLDIVPFQDDFGLDWLIAVVVPEADFMRQIYANTRTTVLLALVGLALAMVLAILAAQILTRPVIEVCEAAENLAQGNFDQRVTTPPIREMRRLSRTFNSMALQLQSSFAALSQSEATNRAIIEAIPDLLMRTYRDGTYIDIVSHGRLPDQTGLKVGNRVQDSLPPLLAEQRLEMMQAALATGTLQVCEQHFKSGPKTLHEEVRVAALNQDEVLVMVRNITQRKRAETALRIAEENYRSIYENALEGIFQSNTEGRFMSVNPAMAKLYGYASPAQMAAAITDIAQQIYVDSGDCHRFTQLMAQQGYVQGFEYRSYRRDGQVIWVEEDTRAVKDDTGNILYYEGMIKDVSDRKQREAALQNQLQELQIEIDETKKAQDVAQLTESGYFQEIETEVTQIDLDSFWS